MSMTTIRLHLGEYTVIATEKLGRKIEEALSTTPVPFNVIFWAPRVTRGLAKNIQWYINMDYHQRHSLIRIHDAYVGLAEECILEVGPADLVDLADL